jgi:molybdenum cofactor biosynthesis enzyme MoaA
VAEQSLTDLWEGRAIEKMRSALTDYDFSNGCNICEWQITGGNYRSSGPAMYEDFALSPAEIQWPQIMGFALSNACNFECIMCSGENSSLIRSRREGLPPLPRMYADRFFEDLKPFLRNLKRAMFHGGEPFLMPECFRIWDMMISEGLNIPCHVTTNASVYSSRIERVLDSLPMSLSISMDGVTRKTQESIRVNCDFDEFMQNIDRFHNHSKRRGFHLAFNFCLMRQNWHEFGDLLLFAEELGRNVFVNTVVSPESCDIQTLPREELKDIVAQLHRQGQQLKGRLRINQSVWDEQLALLEASSRAQAEDALVQIRSEISAELPSGNTSRAVVADATKFADAGQLEEALQELSKLDPGNPLYYEGLVLRASAHRRMGNSELAEIEVANAIRISRKPHLALVERARLRSDQRRYAEALADLDEAILGCGEHETNRHSKYSALVVQGRVYHRMGDSEKAASVFRQVALFSPLQAEALLELQALGNLAED